MLLWPRSGRAICLKLVEKRCKRGSARHCLRSFGRRTCNTFGIFWHSHFHWLVLNLDRNCFEPNWLNSPAGSWPMWRIQSKPCKGHHQDLWHSNHVLLDADHGASDRRVSSILSLFGSESIESPSWICFVCSTGCHHWLDGWCDRLHLELTHRTQETWGYFQWVQNYWQEHGILPDLREPLFMAMAVFSALPMSNILLSSINNHVPKLLFRFLVLATLITFHSHEYNTLIITLIIWYYIYINNGWV